MGAVVNYRRSVTTQSIVGPLRTIDAPFRDPQTSLASRWIQSAGWYITYQVDRPDIAMPYALCISNYEVDAGYKVAITLKTSGAPDEGFRLLGANEALDLLVRRNGVVVARIKNAHYYNNLRGTLWEEFGLPAGSYLYEIEKEANLSITGNKGTLLGGGVLFSRITTF